MSILSMIMMGGLAFLLGLNWDALVDIARYCRDLVWPR